jgi:hypothetical protein
MHMIPGWPKVSYMFSCLRWCYVFCVICGFFAFCNFLSSILYVSLLCFLIVPFMSYVGFFCCSSCQLCLLYLCVFDIIHVPRFFCWYFILVFVFSMFAMGFWAWICYCLLSLCPCVFLLLFVVILVFRGCESKGWNFELRTWKKRIETCKHHILIH